MLDSILQYDHLVSIFSEELVYMWYILDYGDYVENEPFPEDLYLMRLDTDSVGIQPEWLDEEEGDLGPDFFVEPGWSTEDTGEGWVFITTWARWGLMNGIAPRQPFLVRIEKPIWRIDYWGEADVEICWDMIYVKKISEFEKCIRWERFFEHRAKYREQSINKMRYLESVRANDKSAMYISYNVYGGYRSPVEYSVCLNSKHTNIIGLNKTTWPSIAEGRGKTREEAFNNMVSSAKFRTIGLTKKQIERMETVIR